MKKIFLVFLFFNFTFFGCSSNDTGNGVSGEELTIFFINDQHGQLDNFSKLKHIVDKERQETNVILACSGDMFSGNPVVDNHSEKGFPMIDLMNKVGFDISVVGNHEFDYGETVLYDRMVQANFSWVCANVDMGNTGIPQPDPFKTLEIGDLKVTFLGLVETNGKENGTIPSTHPWRVQNFVFTRPEEVVGQYEDLKTQEGSDLLIALTHLGHDGGQNYLGDFQLAGNYPFFDLIIGGHSHQKVSAFVNDTHIFQAGSYLNYLGKVKLTIMDKEVKNISYDLIDLNAYSEIDHEIQDLVDEYNETPELEEVVGYSQINHSSGQLGCFYTDALRIGMNVDFALQNSGGIRSGVDKGDISIREVYEVDPFNNGAVIYQMSVGEIKKLLKETGSGFYYSGIEIRQQGNEVIIMDPQENILDDDMVLKLGINDYIPAVHDDYFPNDGDIQDLTTAETVIKYLTTVNDQVYYPECQKYFRFE